LLLVFCEDLDSIHNSVDKRTRPDSANGVLVEPFVKPRDLAHGCKVLEASSAFSDDVLYITTIVHESISTTETDISSSVPGVVSNPIIHLTDRSGAGEAIVQMSDEFAQSFIHQRLSLQHFRKSPESSDGFCILEVKILILSVEDVLNTLSVD
jgi:hypothetical protein